MYVYEYVLLLIINYHKNSRKCPRFGVEKRRKGKEAGAHPDAQEENPGARFGHPWL